MSELVRDGVLGEVPRERTRDISKYECNVVGKGFGDESRQNGESIVGSASNARNSAISKDQNGSDGVNVLLDLSDNLFLVELVLLNTSSVGQPRGVEDANLGTRLCIFTTLEMPVLTTAPFLLVNL